MTDLSALKKLNVKPTQALPEAAFSNGYVAAWSGLPKTVCPAVYKDVEDRWLDGWRQYHRMEKGDQDE